MSGLPTFLTYPCGGVKVLIYKIKKKMKKIYIYIKNFRDLACMLFVCWNFQDSVSLFYINETMVGWKWEQWVVLMSKK